MGFTTNDRVPTSIALIVIALAILGAVMFVNAQNHTKGKTTQAQEVAHKQDIGAWVVQSIQYMKDVRTGICFAFWREEHRSEAGVAIATVPCEAIPSELLIIPTK